MEALATPERRRWACKSINMDKELQGHIDRTDAMLEQWLQYGVNESDELSVDFHFYSASKESADNLFNELSTRGHTSTMSQTRTLLIFKGWNIELQIKQQWTLSKLLNRTEELYLLGKQCGASFEGSGAEMPGAEQ